jgi:hypothetical protein
MARSEIGREIVGLFNVIFSLFGTSFISCGFSCADSPSYGKVTTGAVKVGIGGGSNGNSNCSSGGGGGR